MSLTPSANPTFIRFLGKFNNNFIDTLNLSDVEI